MKPSELSGKVVYAVGASMGIGLSIAEKAAAFGADIVVFARRREPLEEAVRVLGERRRRPQQRFEWRQLDVGEHSEVMRVMNAAVVELGAPDLLVNCAGGAQPRHFDRIPREQLMQTMRVNLFGTWSAIQTLLPHMEAHGGGHIVNVSSLAGLIGVFGYTDYCASKFALVGFSEALRSELKPRGIGVSVLCPPDTDTPGFAKENEDKPAETRAVSANARVLSAEQVADSLFRGLGRDKFLIIPGIDGKAGALAKRLFPGLVERVIDYTIRKSRKR